MSWALHFVLDTFTGGIVWLYPFNGNTFMFFTVPPISQSWVVSFVFHWTFLIEISIVVLAAAIFVKSRVNKS
jgi:hypothetical protein